MSHIRPLLAFVCLFFLAHLASATYEVTTPYDAITRACNGNPSPLECLKLLSTKPESKTTYDTHHLVELAIRVAAETATDLAKQFKQLLEDHNDDKDSYQCLDDCTETYEDAVAQLDDSTGGMDQNDFVNVKKWIAAALADADTCDAACKSGMTLPDLVQLQNKISVFRNQCKIMIGVLGKLN